MVIVILWHGNTPPGRLAELWRSCMVGWEHSSSIESGLFLVQHLMQARSMLRLQRLGAYQAWWLSRLRRVEESV